MKRIAVIVLPWLFLASSFGQAGEYSSYPVIFSQEKLQEDFRQFRSFLEETHPALYDYTAKEVLDSLFEHNLARIDTALEFTDFLVLMTEVISQVGCGHSSMWIPGAFWDVAPDGLFPFKMHINKAQVDESRPGEPELSFQELVSGRVGLLTINSFGYYGKVDWFKAFMDSVFVVCREKQLENLILDLKGNSGGDPFCASYLWAYLQPKPLPYFMDHYGRYDTLANPVPQPVNPFTGQLYTLIDGHCFSTTGHFLGLLDYHDVGKFVGSESGATYTCTGNATYPALDHTGIMVGTARVMRYTAAVKDMDPRRGILPDYPVEITPQDLIRGKDVFLDYALSLISEQ